MLLRITASAFNDRGPLYMEQVLAGLHEAMRTSDVTTLSLRREQAWVGITCDVPPPLKQLVTTQLLSQYPSALVGREEPLHDALPMWTAELMLQADIFPLKRHPQFADAATQASADPLSGILSALAAGEHDPLRPRVDFVVRPAPLRRVRRSRHILRNLTRTGFTNDPDKRERYLRLAFSNRWPQRLLARWHARMAGKIPVERPEGVATARTHDRETAMQAAHDKLRRRIFEVQLRLSVRAPADQEERALAKLQELAGALGSFCEPDQATWRLLSLRRGEGKRRHARGFLLSAEELATLWHLPVFSLKVPTLELCTYRQLEPPVGLPDPRREQGTTTLGRTNFRDHHRPFGIRPDDRRRHVYVVGKTGMGKSTLLLNMLADDIAAGRGCCLVDPHGDLAEAAVGRIPSRRTNDVIYFDAGDQNHPLAFNPLADCDPRARPLVASGMLAAFKKLYGDSWGPRLEHIFRNCLLTLLETPGASLLTLVQLLGDAGFRRSVMNRVRDPVVRAFWLQEFAGMPQKLQAEAIAPIQNKVGQFVSSPLLRHILGQPRSTIDLRKVMDRGQVLILNLSKGRVGEDASSLLGSLLITSLQLAAMSRADVREDQRPDFHLYVDEFQHFATESFASVLSEARKYRLTLTLANQYLAQMDEATAAAVFGNAGSLVSFQVGADDAESLAMQLGAPATPQDLSALPKHEAYARLLIDGLPSRPFSLRTLPPADNLVDDRRSDIIRRASRRRYGRPLATVAAEIEQGFARAL
jgi:hypothetical protein